MVKELYFKGKKDCSHLLGKFLDESTFDTMIDFDCDIYSPSLDGSMTEDNIVAKFRKNVFTTEEQLEAYEGLRGAAKISHNRGIAAGLVGEAKEPMGKKGVLKARVWVTPQQLEILDYLENFGRGLVQDTLDEVVARGKKLLEDNRSLVWLGDTLHKEFPDSVDNPDWLTDVAKRSDNSPPEYKHNLAKDIRKLISDTNYAPQVMSGVAGYYGRYPRIPFGRATAYTEQNPELFVRSFPFLKRLNNEFKKLLPERWGEQKRHCDMIDKRFVIDDTVFTTLTVNHNWRTAAHFDAGDLGPGFSNLTAISSKPSGWKGGALVLPEYRAAVNLRQGDLLLVANHTALHGNLPLEGDDNDRLSVVAYFREDMLQLKSWEYEAARRQFITERSKNENDPYWRPQWNGVAPGWETSDEWRLFLKAHNMKDEDGKVSTGKNLEDFFG